MTTTESDEITGWKWTMFAGFIPLTAGIFMLLTSKISVANADAVWTFLIHSLNFGFADLSAVDPQAGPLVVLLADLASINIVSAALAVILISRYVLRYGKKWAWWYLLFSLVWVGFNDAYGVTVFFLETGAPMFIMPWGFLHSYGHRPIQDANSGFSVVDVSIRRTHFRSDRTLSVRADAGYHKKVKKPLESLVGPSLDGD